MNDPHPDNIPTVEEVAAIVGPLDDMFTGQNYVADPLPRRRPATDLDHPMWGEFVGDPDDE